MSQVPEPFPLIRTKLYRPPMVGDLIERTRLLERLDSRRQRPFFLISAPAGHGKTTLVSQWLSRAPYQAAWLSLDEHDNDLMVFLTYVVAAIQTLFPQGCSTTQSLLTGSARPPLAYLSATLVNDISQLPDEFMLVLDDYHQINHPDIHQLITALLDHPVPHMHLGLITRQDPPISLSKLRASQQMTELRMYNLRFTPTEVQRYLKRCVGAEISPEMVTLLATRMEGWAVGLRMACLALRNKEDYTDFLETLQATNQYIMEYLLNEVLSHQPKSIQPLMLYTSILDRFCAPLIDALIEDGPNDNRDETWPSGQEILTYLQEANLFVSPTGQQNDWFRYHHVFRDLLLYKLRAETSADHQATLHKAAGRWLAKHGFTDEALSHFFEANDTAAAVDLVAQQRYTWLNQAQWQLIQRELDQFSADVRNQHPDLLMLEVWLLYHHGQWAKIPVVLDKLESAIAGASLSAAVNHLWGEINTVRSLLLGYFRADPKSAIEHARQALAQTSYELWSVRILARTVMAIALQMRGDLDQAYAILYDGFEMEQEQSNLFKATLLIPVCEISWVAADLPALIQAAQQSISLSRDTQAVEITGHSHYRVGMAYYQQNNLADAEKHFAVVAQQPYLNYGPPYVYSACGLALTYQAQGQPDKAREVAEAASAFMLQTGNTTLLPVTQAFQAELALRQGDMAVAARWADEAPSTETPLAPMIRFYEPYLTLVKIRLAQDTSKSHQQQAGELLRQLQTFLEKTHNKRFLIEALALKALWHSASDEPDMALTLLEQALEMAQPSGFIRLFVDLGPPLARLLAGLTSEDTGRQQYIQRLLSAFDQEKPQSLTGSDGSSQPLIEPLTDRELEILELLAQRLSDKEIAGRLIISPVTVKSHTRNIFGKLNVHKRRQAVSRARKLGLLSSK